jgi:hypothetical protein
MQGENVSFIATSFKTAKGNFHVVIVIKELTLSAFWNEREEPLDNLITDWHNR